MVYQTGSVIKQITSGPNACLISSLQCIAVGKCPNSHQIFVTIDEWVYWLLALVSPTAFAMAFDRLMVFENLNLPIDLWASMGSMPLGGMLIMLAVGNKMG